ncbi:hypothetical protein IEQ34_002191 [Dendrobium chrysotoxum]|uniref:Expansin-like EG45 domain-containing protein n=1 Tax=Dendrobium chrysotoxum TaxID=161865 RepID=A0AAV7H583_DENCH|nr:hypothetical protein IEQ34_002191 [Dendrobium chrysotoxum]
MKEETIIFAVTMLLCLTSFVSTSVEIASSYPQPYLRKCQPTSKPSACYGYSDKGTNIIAVSDALWDNRNACGRKYRVWCKPVNEVKFQHCTRDFAVDILGYDVTVVDYCGHCNGFTMLLSQEVFSALTNTEDGVIHVEYNEI